MDEVEADSRAGTGNVFPVAACQHATSAASATGRGFLPRIADFYERLAGFKHGENGWQSLGKKELEPCV